MAPSHLPAGKPHKRPILINHFLSITLPLTEFFLRWDLRNQSSSEAPKTPPSGFIWTGANEDKVGKEAPVSLKLRNHGRAMPIKPFRSYSSEFPEKKQFGVFLARITSQPPTPGSGRRTTRQIYDHPLSHILMLFPQEISLALSLTTISLFSQDPYFKEPSSITLFKIASPTGRPHLSLQLHPFSSQNWLSADTYRYSFNWLSLAHSYYFKLQENMESYLFCLLLYLQFLEQ